jgi:hypothetical protein
MNQSINQSIARLFVWYRISHRIIGFLTKNKVSIGPALHSHRTSESSICNVLMDTTRASTSE